MNTNKKRTEKIINPDLNISLITKDVKDHATNSSSHATVNDSTTTVIITPHKQPNKRLRTHSHDDTAVSNTNTHLSSSSSSFVFPSIDNDSPLITYTDILSIVAANGYREEMQSTLSINKEIWYQDELMWSLYVNKVYGDQHKTHFLWSILTHQISRIQYYIHCGAKINARCGIALSSTPLIIACISGNPEVVKVLVKHGASVLTEAICKRTKIPEHYYSEYDREKTTITIPHMKNDDSSILTNLPFINIGYATTIKTRSEWEREMGISPPAFEEESDYNSVYWLLYGYYYYNSQRPFYIPSILKDFDRMYNPPENAYYGDYPDITQIPIEKLRETIPLYLQRNTLRYQQCLEYLVASDPTLLQNHTEQILLMAINMRCYNIAKAAIDAGGHYAMSVTADGPTAVILAAYIASLPKETYSPLPSSSPVMDPPVLHYLDTDMVEIVRLLCMKSNKPRDPDTNKIIKHHHCLIAASYVNLVDVVEYLLADEGKDTIRSLMNPLGLSVDAYDKLGIFTKDYNIRAIHIAYYRGNTEILKLLEKHTDFFYIMTDTKLQNSLMHWCAYHDNNLPLLRRLLDCRVYKDLGTGNADGKTPFMIACEYGQIENVKELLQYSNCVDIQNTKPPANEYTALHYAVQSNHIPIVKLLCQSNDVNLNNRNTNEISPCMLAIEYNYVDIVVIFLQEHYTRIQNGKGYALNLNHVPYTKDRSYYYHSPETYNIFQYACKFNRLEIVKRLCNFSVPLEYLEQYSGSEREWYTELSKVNMAEKTGGTKLTPLMIACKEGHEDIVKELLKYVDQLDVNSTCVEYGNTALHYAAYGKYYSIVRLLCAIPSLDLNIRNHKIREEVTVFEYAIQNNIQELIDIFMPYINRIDFNRIGPEIKLFYTACALGKIDLVNKLIMYPNIDMNQRHDENRTPFIVACITNRLDIIKLLVQYPDRCDINARSDYFQFTGFMEAIARNHIDIVKYLLTIEGIDKSLKFKEDVETISLMNYLKKWERKDMIALLLEYGIE